MGHENRAVFRKLQVMNTQDQKQTTQDPSSKQGTDPTQRKLQEIKNLIKDLTPQDKQEILKALGAGTGNSGGGKTKYDEGYDVEKQRKADQEAAEKEQKAQQKEQEDARKAAADEQRKADDQRKTR